MQKLMLKKHINKLFLVILTTFCSALWAQSTDRIIVKFKNGKRGILTSHINSDKMAKMQSTIHAKLHFKRQMLDGASVFHLEKETPIAEVKAYTKALSLQDDIEYAEPDYRKYPAAFSDEARFNDQWYLHNATSVKVSALNMIDAWAIEDGTSNPITVAIIDSGYLPNTPDLDNQYAAGSALNGYDFISADSAGVFVTANDGDGRDTNPEDAGDGFTTTEYFNNSSLLNCITSNQSDEASSWHGTFVAGIVAAQANGNDIVGVNPNAKILPLRVLGRCGGYTADIADAIRWAAGSAVSGIANNSNVAKVLNLSLGSTNACTNTEQSAIDAAFNAGSVIMVAAGNEGQLASASSPANCNHVMVVSAITQGGAETDYTNYGETVDIAAPGGSGLEATQILSLSNDGLQSRANAVLKFEIGTSFSTPMVAGVASLMLSLNPNLTPSQIMGIMKKTASSFPVGTSDGARDCQVINCGEGMLNAKAALQAVKDDILTEDYNNATSSLSNITRVASSGSLNFFFSITFALFVLIGRLVERP